MEQVSRCTKHLSRLLNALRVCEAFMTGVHSSVQSTHLQSEGTWHHLYYSVHKLQPLMRVTGVSLPKGSLQLPGSCCKVLSEHSDML